MSIPTPVSHACKMTLFKVILTEAYVISTFNDYAIVTDFMLFEMHQCDTKTVFPDSY